MITAELSKNYDGTFSGFRVSGHAGLADEGYDVCCASVSSAVMLTANTLTDVFSIESQVSVDEPDGAVSLVILQDRDGIGSRLIQGLHIHLKAMQEEFPKRIRIVAK